MKRSGRGDSMATTQDSTASNAPDPEPRIASGRTQAIPLDESGIRSARGLGPIPRSACGAGRRRDPGKGCVPAGSRDCDRALDRDLAECVRSGISRSHPITPRSWSAKSTRAGCHRPAGVWRDSKQHPTTAQLVIEISDTTLSFDRGVKSRLYARASIREYWIVNLVDNQSWRSTADRVSWTQAPGGMSTPRSSS